MKLILKPVFWAFAFVFISISGCFIARNKFYADPQAKFQEALANKPYDAIIIPGYPYDSTAGWDRIVKGRIYWALFLYNKGIAKNIIFSGGAVYTPYVESKIMALYAEKLGIPKEHIFTETHAEHSTENLYYSYELGKSLGFNKIALATDPVQSSFLLSYKKKFKLKDLSYIPMLYDTLEVMTKTDPEINPDSAYVKNFVPLTEKESFYRRFRGTTGAKVRKELREKHRQERKLKKEKKQNAGSNK